MIFCTVHFVIQQVCFVLFYTFVAYVRLVTAFNVLPTKVFGRVQSIETYGFPVCSNLLT